jgi:hypothetical protein
MADKTDEPNTPTGESPVYDSLVDGGEPVVATVDSDPDAADDTSAPVEPDEIVVEDETETVEYADGEPVVVEEATAVVDEPAEAPYQAPYVAPTPTPQYASTTAQPNVVYVNAPQPPVEKSNRGFGALIALLATVAFMVVLAIVMVIIYSARSGALYVDFLGQTAFYVPALFFFVGAILLTLLLNRAGWWTYVIGSLVLALFVYFGTIATVLVINGVVLLTPAAAAEQFRLGTVSPFTIAAALVAREVMLWAGAIIASRGRKVKVRNAEALETFQREQAQTRGY